MKMKEEITVAAAKAAPPVAVTSAQVLFGLTLNEWVSIATLIYIALQAFFLVRNEIRKRKK
jgi:hypothetical protein